GSRPKTLSQEDVNSGKAARICALPNAACFPFNAAAMDRRLFLALAGGLLASPLPAVAVPPPPLALRRLVLSNAHTGENFDGPYRDDLGPISLAMEELSHFLRDHHSGERTEIDVGVIDFLVTVMDAVGATRATILSA